MPRRMPRLVVEDGKATAVILDIEIYREMLERLEDLEDLRMLEEIRKKPLDLQSLEDFLAEHASDVWGFSGEGGAERPGGPASTGLPPGDCLRPRSGS